MLCRTAGLLALLLIAGCDDDDLTYPTVATDAPPTQDPAHHQGRSCIECHTDWDLSGMHDAASVQYNPDCISCHGDMMDRTTLSADVKEIHPTMIPWVLPAGGEPLINNETCAYCHGSVDFFGGSAGNLRKQVAITICAGCHGPAGPATNVLYR